MTRTTSILLKSLLLLLAVPAFAQNSVRAADNGCKWPIGRAMWHDRIDREQRNALRTFQGNQPDDVKYFVNQTLTKRVDQLQCRIETDTTQGDQRKKTYLSGVEKILKNFNTQYQRRRFNAAHLPSVFEAYEAAVAADLRKESVEPIVIRSPYDVGMLLLASDAFTGNTGYRAAKNELLRKYCHIHPDQVFVQLSQNSDVPFRDSLIKLAGYRYPKKLYDYAAADNRLGYAIRSIDDPFIKAVAQMARSGGSGQLYFPFLDNIIANKITIKDIDAVKEDPLKYYQLLVKTRMDYVTRSLDGERIASNGVLDTMLQRKAQDYFIKQINALHEQPDPVRYRVIQPLTAQELYYLVIAGERDMYTSSYVKGIFPLMMQKIGNKGDSLLMSVSFDRFKKFIKIAAGYNTLKDFLASFPDKDKAQTLMAAFVNGLERSSSLEDGVDVADSYASIAETNRAVADEMLKNVKSNYDKNVRDNNKRGAVIYNLLYKLFLSAADSTINLSKEFGIPPVYNVSYNSLVSDSAGRVVMQVFFYGDKDGLMNYQNFLPTVSGPNWKKVEDNKNWIAFSTTKGKPILIYANKWIDEQKEGELEKAQAALDEYLETKRLNPTIIVHRGHSYYAGSTIEQIPSSARIVILGSCGGYNLIHEVLKRSSDAHIVSSKQVGKKDINQPMMNLLNEKLRTGASIDWIPFWNEFKSRAGKVEGFEDYIPPYKNLGAIFIKAYNRSMGEEI